MNTHLLRDNARHHEDDKEESCEDAVCGIYHVGHIHPNNNTSYMQNVVHVNKQYKQILIMLSKYIVINAIREM